MFFKKRRKLSIQEEDKVIIDNAFLTIQNLFGKANILNGEVVTPTKEFFPINFQGREKDAIEIFKLVASFMKVDDSKIDIVFYSERRNIEPSGGLIPVLDENEVLTTGRYVEYDNGDIEVFIEEQELKDFTSLIATISHELAHFKLRTEVLFKEEDEVLTDVLTIAFGLGVFTANASIVKMDTWTDGNLSGWQLKGGGGYLHHKVCSYALALYSYMRNEDSSVQWTEYLEKDVYKEYKKGFDYLKHSN